VTLRHLSLFTGIGGFDRGFDEAGGIETVAQVEIDPFCNRVLERRYATTSRTRDINDFDGRPFCGSVDVVSFGSPCQGLSVAGHRAGLARRAFRSVLRGGPHYRRMPPCSCSLGERTRCI